MKKFAHFASTAVVALSLFGGVAAADTNCNGTISTTGTNSTNTVTCVDNNNNTVSCTNNVVVSNNNSQNSTSGNANNSGNTTSGGSSSGNASNSNTTAVTVGASCSPVGSTGDFTVAATPSTPAPAASTPQVQSDQIAVKPVGAVAAGGGAGVSTDKAGLVTGMAASLAAIGVGVSLVLRKRFQA